MDIIILTYANHCVGHIPSNKYNNQLCLRLVSWCCYWANWPQCTANWSCSLYPKLTFYYYVTEKYAWLILCLSFLLLQFYFLENVLDYVLHNEIDKMFAERYFEHYVMISKHNWLNYRAAQGHRKHLKTCIHSWMWYWVSCARKCNS